MKVRILNNSVRFRMSMDEMKQLSQGEEVRSLTEFASNHLLVMVRLASGPPLIDLKDGNMQLTIDRGEFLKLEESTKEVSITMDINGLSILFEKDFKCLTERSEDESNLYPNPHSKH